MKSIEVVGRTKDEAIGKALEDLGLNRSQVGVEIVDEGNKGFLGLLGGRPVRVRVWALGEDAFDPSEVVRTLLTLMNVDFGLEVKRDSEGTQVRILSERDDGLLIGRRGQTLDALRHLAQRIIAARLGRDVVVNIDVGEYRARREEQLRERALEVAAQARDEGRSVALDPMSAQDRRVIHLALADEQGVTTYTVGSGARRRVVVGLEGEQKPAGARDFRSFDSDQEELGELPELPETAYGDVPDPSFRAARLSESEEPSGQNRRRFRRAEGAEEIPGERFHDEAPAVERRDEGARPRERRGEGGPARSSRPRASDRRRNADRGLERGADRGPERGSDRGPERGSDRGPERGESGGRSGGGERDRERGRRGGDRERGGERGRDRDRGRERSRDRDRGGEERRYGSPRKDEDLGSPSSGPREDEGAERREEHAPVVLVPEGSADKPFSSDLAKAILQIGGSEKKPGGSAPAGRRRSRR